MRSRIKVVVKYRMDECFDGLRELSGLDGLSLIKLSSSLGFQGR